LPEVGAHDAIDDGDDDDEPRAADADASSQTEEHQPLVLRNDLDGVRQHQEQKRQHDDDRYQPSQTAHARPPFSWPATPATVAFCSAAGDTTSSNPFTSSTRIGAPA